MKNWVYQIQLMLADELDKERGQGTHYVNDNLWEIQDIYRDKKQKRLQERKEKDEEVILIKPYKILATSSRTTSSKITELSFIHDEIKNLEWHMKFIHSPTQTRLFKLLPHYQSLQFREEQNLEFWKEVAIVFVGKKHNTETSRNSYLVTIYQGGPLHESYFIAIDNWEQVFIGPNKKIVATHVFGEFKVLV